MSNNNETPKQNHDWQVNFGLFFFIVGIVTFAVFDTFGTKGLWLFFGSIVLLIACLLFILLFSGKSKKEKDFEDLFNKYQELPNTFKEKSDTKVFLGRHKEIDCPIYLENKIRSRHVHIIGATGTGKTESVIMNLIKQDAHQGHPVVILDGKGDLDFLEYLKNVCPEEKLEVFDLNGDQESISYNPLSNGTPLEASERLFNSLTWSDEFYRITSRAVLSKIFAYSNTIKKRNPTLVELSKILESSESLTEALMKNQVDKAETYKNTFDHVLGLKHQIDHLCREPLNRILSSTDSKGALSIQKAIQENKALYFRLPSLTNFETASMVGKLIIGDLAHIAGEYQKKGVKGKFCPVFLDEFSCFVCDSFRRLIGLARSAGMALHYSHQSLGDLKREDPSFFTTLSDSTATKIALRVGDYDTADYLSKLFGTHAVTKVTERIELESEDESEILLHGQGSLREAQKFNLDPNILKSTHTGEGHAIIAHSDAMSASATHYLPIKFPKLTIQGALS